MRANKARENLPRFPKPKPQRDVAGRHYLTKSDLYALYFATYAHRDLLACKAIMSLPQPSAFNALVHGFDGECACCRPTFPQA